MEAKYKPPPDGVAAKADNELSDRTLAILIRREPAAGLLAPEEDHVSAERRKELELLRDELAEQLERGEPGVRKIVDALVRRATVVYARKKHERARREREMHEAYAKSARERDEAKRRLLIPGRARTVCPQPVAAHDCEAGRSRQSKPKPTAKRTTSSGRSPDDPAPGPSDPPAAFDSRDLRQLVALAASILPAGASWSAWEKLAREIRRRLRIEPHASGAVD